MKGIKKYMLFLLLLICLTACEKSIEQQISEQLQLGQKYLTEQNYEQAIVAFEKVIEIEPKCWDAYTSIAAVYGIQNNLVQAAAIMEQGIVAIGIEEIPSIDIDKLVGFYRTLAEEAAKNGNQELAMECYQKILALRPESEDILTRQREVREISQYQSQLKNMAIAITQEENYTFSDTLILSDEFQELIKNLTEPIAFQLEDGNFVVVYPGGYIYSGEMKDGIREGSGRWFYGTMKSITIVTCPWKNDKPNGSGVIKRIINPAMIEREANHTYSLLTTYKLTLVDGVYEGSCNVKWVMEGGHIHEWDVAYAGGRLQSISEDIAAYCKNCNANLNVGASPVHKVGGID